MAEEEFTQGVHLENTEEARDKFDDEANSYSCNVIQLSEQDIAALREGKQIAYLINDGEYTLFVTGKN